jgi:hypothetical protein
MSGPQAKVPRQQAAWQQFAPFLALILFTFPNLAAPATPTNVDFDRQIRPILSDNCFTCHGPDEKRRMMNLHFDTKDGAFNKPGIIVPGNSAASKMYLKISHPDVAQRMPPASSGRKLTQAQIDLIKNWIDSGAKWETHWAYAVPVRPDLPAVGNEAWAKTPIDRFVLAKLDKEGLHAAPEAPKSVLLRRVTFDLTGLPPTSSELDSFLSDNSPNAYEKVVDRLLASPHYGERMAVPWLDLARYSDTHGYHIDSLREMWPWRDWVIQAFNSNMPYNEFTVEQLAGDLLPNATQSQRIATGFNRNHMINFEGGAIPEEYQNEYIVDRIEATSTTWLGSTLGCARCHDHKYDPFTQKEFYSFGAFFNAVPEKGLDGKTGNAAPFLQLPNEQQAAMKKALLDAIHKQDAAVGSAERQWEQQQRQVPVSDVTSGLTDEYLFDDSLANRMNESAAAKLVTGKLTYTDGRNGRAADLEAEPQLSIPALGQVSTTRPFSITFFLKPGGPSGMSILQKYEDPAKKGQGYEIALDYCSKNNCNVIVKMTGTTADSLLSIKTQHGLELEAWNHLAVTYDGSGSAKGIQVYVDGVSVPIDTISNTSFNATFDKGLLQIGNKDWGTPLKGQLSDLRFYQRRLYTSEVLQLGLLAPLRQVIEHPLEKRSSDQQRWLRKYFLAQVASPREAGLDRDRATLQRGLDQLNREIPSTMVMADMDKPRPTYILRRGDYQLRGDEVTPTVPAVLPPLPKDAPLNRLTLAKWIVDPANPLTARVAVNHFWQMYFGLGIVKTSEDFGSQGDPPSNQALLDWMATEFVRTGWDVKAMQKLIVMSAVYRQDSKVSPQLLERDPENRLLARGPRFRLPAEMIHDQALAISGLLTTKIGGRSVSPYQPKGLWEEMAFGGEFTGQTYEQSHGEDLYRRAMYTIVKRTVPYPGLNTFDAPDREKCTARRTTTNTPLQALVLLNDPTYVEAARVLAQRDLAEAKPTEAERIRYVFRLATDRNPSPAEETILAKLYQREHAHYADAKDAADKLLTVGETKPDPRFDPAELAAWTLVASAVLNMDESITRN